MEVTHQVVRKNGLNTAHSHRPADGAKRAQIVPTCRLMERVKPSQSFWLLSVCFDQLFDCLNCISARAGRLIDFRAVKRLKYLIVINRINVIVNSN